jgi:hypothetical protein
MHASILPSKPTKTPVFGEAIQKKNDEQSGA